MQKQNLTMLGKQRQLTQDSTKGAKNLQSSFKNTSNLAKGLVQDRVEIKTDQLEKISAIKQQLEEIKQQVKTKEPLFTEEEKASRANKAQIKGTNSAMQTLPVSETGPVMIEKQRDSRRQRHIASIQESQKFIEQFYDNFTERKNEIRERSRVFTMASDQEIQALMNSLTDEKLLASELSYVNGVWEKCVQHRSARKADSDKLADEFEKLRDYQSKGSTVFLQSLRDELIFIAFQLQPEIDELMVKYQEEDQIKYQKEHQECQDYLDEVVTKDKAKFEELYTEFKSKVAVFQQLKQKDAIQVFLDRMNSLEFVNSKSRQEIFNDMREEQMSLFKQREAIVKKLESTRPIALNTALVLEQEDELRICNEDSSLRFDQLVDRLAKDMENTNEDIDIVLFDLKDFLIKNDAQLEPGESFDSILDQKVQPTVDRRKLEAKTLVQNSIAYMEDTDYKMGEICTNLVNFYKEFAKRLDTNKDKLKQTDVQFKVSLAQCGDNNDDKVQELEDLLTKQVDEMKGAIHHVALNGKLDECFLTLDNVQKTFRQYNTDYSALVQQHPDNMRTFYNEFEANLLLQFKMHPEAAREQIQEMLKLETEQKQAELEKQALAEHEKKQREEEAKAAAEQLSNPSGKTKAPSKAPPKKGGQPATPNLDVPKLPVPEVTDFVSEMDNKYIRERTFEEIVQKLMEPPKEEEEEQPVQNQESIQEPPQEAPVQPVQSPPSAGQQKSQAKSSEPNKSEAVSSPPKTKQSSSQVKTPEVVQSPKQENPVETKPEEPPFKPNDFLQKAEMEPPRDPEGNSTMHEDLLLKPERLFEIVTCLLEATLAFVKTERDSYLQNTELECNELVDKSVEELDENLRMQWPRKGRLEVEVYNERKAQISFHNKKYERHVRGQLEKYNSLGERWTELQTVMHESFEAFQEKHERVKGTLADGKNLAELQGTSRRSRDNQTQFADRCRDFTDQMNDLCEVQPGVCVKQNADMLKSCKIIEDGGHYSVEEIEWYREQMNQIDELFDQIKEKRKVDIDAMTEQIELLQKDPAAAFTQSYLESIQQLSAKDGLGKTFGQPRRLAQERLRAEMTKCQQAQEGIDNLIDNLDKLLVKARNPDSRLEEQAHKSVSIQIRMNLVQTLRCIMHYANHTAGFKTEMTPLERINYREDIETILLNEEESVRDKEKQEEELECLGPIGFKNTKEPYLKFPEAIQKVDQQCRDLCTKLYATPETQIHLQTPEKIPEYLVIFLEKMKRQADAFRINQVRQLRTSTERLEGLLQEVPHAVFSYLLSVYTNELDGFVGDKENDFDQFRSEDQKQRDNHLRLFRPNLENPANKQVAADLNSKEQARTEKLQDQIDDVQIELFDLEEEWSQKFYIAFLNNFRALVAIFDRQLFRENFIAMPGDECVEKKHLNIRNLMAMEQNQDLSKRETRKWPGLGYPVFYMIDLEKLSPSYIAAQQNQSRPVSGKEPAGTAKSSARATESEEIKVPENELNTEVILKNTASHKALIKARDQYYNHFKKRFLASIRHIFDKYDTEREEESKFNTYWNNNFKEISQKHI